MEAKTAARGSLEHVTASDGELLRRYHRDGDVVARQLLIERHVGFVRRLAKRYSHRGEATEDLVQVGCVGLIKAIDRYDGQFQASLATYAAPNVLGEIKRHFRDKGWAIRVPRDVQELNVKLSRVVDELTVKLGRSPSVEELAEATKTTPEEVLEALDSSRAYSAFSLSDRTDDDEEGPSPLDTLGEGGRGLSPHGGPRPGSSTGSNAWPAASARSSTCGSSRASRSPRSPSAWASRRCTCRG